MKYPNIKIYLFPPKNKYLDIDRNLVKTKYQRKKCTVEFVKQWLENKSSLELFKKFSDLEKKDDVADSIKMKIEYDKFILSS